MSTETPGTWTNPGNGDVVDLTVDYTRPGETLVDGVAWRHTGIYSSDVPVLKPFGTDGHPVKVKQDNVMAEHVGIPYTEAEFTPVTSGGETE